MATQAAELGEDTFGQVEPALLTRSKRDFRGDLGRWLWDVASKEAGARLGALFLKKKVLPVPRLWFLREPGLSSRPSPPPTGNQKATTYFGGPRLDTYPRGGQKATWKPAQGRWSVPPKHIDPWNINLPCLFVFVKFPDLRFWVWNCLDQQIPTGRTL